MTERNIPGLTPGLRRRMRWLFRSLGLFSPAVAARLAMFLFLTPLARRIDAGEADFLATARQHLLHTPLGRVHAYEWPAAGPTVLVVHGWISHAARLQAVIRALLARGLRVVAIDAPAHGRSAGTQVDLHGFRAAIMAAERELGPCNAIVAHSFGALTGAAWLAESPPAAMRAAVLIGLPRDIGYLFESYVYAMALSPAVVARLRALFRQRYGGEPEDYSARELATRIHLPVLLIHGGADELVPAAQAYEIAEQLSNGTVLVVEGLRHSAPLRDPATIDALVAFLHQHLRHG
jgi:pimeloyl-ACP methyl ester carboxylesterase